MKDTSYFGLKNAFRGIKTFLKVHKSHWIVLFLIILVLFLALPLGLNPIEEILLILNLGLVWVFEMINTALEMTVDMITEEYNEKAKKIKDIASGAVLTTKIIFIINLILLLTNHI